MTIDNKDNKLSIGSNDYAEIKAFSEEKRK